jgi:predicted MFS family arabinose efflux permease
VTPKAFQSVLAPFQVPSFRFQWPADLLTSWALEMEIIILGWYVLVEADSVFLLTVFGALNFGGTLISPILGTVSDRIGPRRLLTMMRSYYCANALGFLLLTANGLLTPVIVLVLVGIVGLIRPSDQGLRAALISESMPREHLTGALGLSRITSDSARAAGALAGVGLSVWLGMAAAFLAIALFYLLGALLTSRVATSPRSSPVAAGAGPSTWQDLLEGLAYIRKTPSLVAAILLVLLFNFTAFPLTNGLLPYVAREVYRVDQTGLGYLVAGLSCGAMLGGILVSNARLSAKTARLMAVAAIVWHMLLLVFAQIETITIAVPFLFCIGFVQSLAMIALTVLLVRDSVERFRGRVMGLRMMAIYSLPIGLMLAGALIELIGFAMTASIYAASGVVLAALITFLWRGSFWPAEGTAGRRI